MSNESFTDEILSAIIDGEADAATIAAVNDNPSARARLEQMRVAVSGVAAPVAGATPERRSASIAAALAAATPAPEVSSLAAARHTRETQTSRSRNTPRWLAVAAAAVFLIVAIPLLSRFGGSDADTADTATAATDSASLGVDDAIAQAASSGDSADSSDDAIDDSFGEAMEEEAMEEAEGAGETLRDMDDGAMADEPAETEAAAAADEPESENAGDSVDEQAPTTVAPSNIATPLTVVSNLEILEEFITLGTIAPQLTAAEVIAEGVSAVCVDPFAADSQATFDVIILDEFGGPARLVLIVFNEDGSTFALDAEDCAQLR